MTERSLGDQTEQKESFPQKIAGFYFEPKRWESERMYRALGIRKLKRLLPETPPYHLKSLSLDNVIKFEKKTRFNESVHTLCVVTYMSIGIGIGLISRDPLNIAIGGATAGTAGALTQLPLIMIQRYNRLRINRILNKAKTSQPTHL